MKGMWSKINDDKDVISFKKRGKEKTIVIEARLDDEKWRIFRTYQVEGSHTLVQEYMTESRDQAVQLIGELKGEKELSNSQIAETVEKQNYPIKLHLQREYKEYDVEKWLFTINESPRINTVIIRYADEIVMDVL